MLPIFFFILHLLSFSVSLRCKFISRSSLNRHHAVQFDGSGVIMGKDSFGGSGLTASKSFKKGDVIVTIPLTMCLLARRDGIILNLVGQSDACWEALGDLREPLDETQEALGRTWDLNLAFALLDATAGEGLAAAGTFFDQYTGALPRPSTVTLPFCMPEHTLAQTQDEGIIERALAQQKRLSNFALFDQQDWHRISGPDASPLAPGPLSWAFAMVRSRCFQVSSDWFAIVPIIEIANHDIEPNAVFLSQSPNNAETDIRDGYCILQASEDIEQGESVLLAYDGTSAAKHDNCRLFTQYGFTLEANPHGEALPWPRSQQSLISDKEPGVNAMSSIQNEMVDLLVDAAIRVLSAEGPGLEGFEGTMPRRVEAVSRSLGGRVRAWKNEIPGATANDCLMHILREVEEMQHGKISSLEDDTALLCALRQATSSSVDVRGHDTELSGNSAFNREQYMACVQYRMESKANIHVAMTMLREAMRI